MRYGSFWWQRVFFNADGGAGGAAPAAGAEGGAAGAAAGGAPAAGATGGDGGSGQSAQGAGSAGAGAAAGAGTAAPAEQAATVALLPKDATDAQRDAFYKTLGRPDNGSGYDLTPPQGQQNDPGMEKWAREAFFKAGLTVDQAKQLYEAWNTQAAAQQAQSAAQADEKVKSDFAAFKQSLGANADQLLAGADKAVEALGLRAENMKALRDAMGFPAVAELMVNIGKRLGGETGSFVTGSGTPSATDPASMSPEQAKATITQLQSDKDFMAIYRDKQHPGNRDAVAKMEKLFAAGYPR